MALIRISSVLSYEPPCFLLRLRGKRKGFCGQWNEMIIEFQRGQFNLELIKNLMLIYKMEIENEQYCT